MKLLDTPVGPLGVIFRPKPNTTPSNMEQWDYTTITRTWWMTVLIPAIHSLAEDSRTHLHNNPATHKATGILPKYFRIYREDVDELDLALADASVTSPLDSDLCWYFACWQFGQQQQLMEGDEVGSHAFGLSEAFQLGDVCRFSAHLAMNIRHNDPRYSLFWNCSKLNSWCHCELLLYLI